MSRSRTVAAIAVGITVALGFGSGAVIAPDANALGSTTTLTVVEGRVLVRHSHAEFSVVCARLTLIPINSVSIGIGATGMSTTTDLKRLGLVTEPRLILVHFIKMMHYMVSTPTIRK